MRIPATYACSLCVTLCLMALALPGCPELGALKGRRLAEDMAADAGLADGGTRPSCEDAGAPRCAPCPSSSACGVLEGVACTTPCGTAGTQVCLDGCGSVCAAPRETCNYCDDDGDGTFADDAALEVSGGDAQRMGCEDGTLLGAGFCNAWLDYVDVSSALWFDRNARLGFGEVLVRASTETFREPAAIAGGEPFEGGWTLSVVAADPLGDDTVRQLGVAPDGLVTSVPVGRRGFALAWQVHDTEPDQAHLLGLQEDGGTAAIGEPFAVLPSLDTMDQTSVYQSIEILIVADDPSMEGNQTRITVRPGLSSDVLYACGSDAPCDVRFEVGEWVDVVMSAGHRESLIKHSVHTHNVIVTESSSICAP